MPRIFNDDRDPVKLALGVKLRKLKRENPEELKKILLSLTPKEAHELQYDEEVWLRPNQWIDLSEKSSEVITLLLAGRGFGKTFTGACTVKRAVEKHGLTKLLLLAYTARDIRATMVPAIINTYPPNHPNRPNWRPGESTLVWPNGAQAVCISSESGEDAPRG